MTAQEALPVAETVTPPSPTPPESADARAIARENLKRAAARLREALTLEERRELLRVDPLRSAWMIASNWVGVFAAMALVAWMPNPLTIVFALWLIGSRQLGMGIVMHEAAHHTLFDDRRLNDWAGNWLAAYPIWTEIAPYRVYHLKHHKYAGTPDDPDLGLAAPFPITRSSFKRKVWRDLSGRTGWTQAKGVFYRDIGWLRGRNQRTLGMNEGRQPDVGWHKLIPVALTNAVLFAVLAAAGYPLLYLLWVVAWLTTYRFISRLRSIAEHGMVPDPLDPLRNTRTIIARWWERLLLAPNRVNFHLEHHLLMTVPHHNLPRMHTMLRDRGVLRDAVIAGGGYLQVLREATAKPEPA
jgi:fatty acid desaturase